MIKFSRDGGDVVVEVKTNLPKDDSRNGEMVVFFRLTPAYDESHKGSYGYAALLTRHLNQRLEKLVEENNRYMYNLGWSDAKAKKRKCVEFKDRLPNNEGDIDNDDYLPF